MIRIDPRGHLDLTAPIAKASVAFAGLPGFIAATPLDAVIAHLRARGVAIESGPADRAGATGPMRPVYVRDPDADLVEIACPADGRGSWTPSLRGAERRGNPVPRRGWIAALRSR